MTDPKQQPTPRGDGVRGLIEKLEGAAEGCHDMDAAIFSALGFQLERDTVSGEWVYREPEPLGGWYTVPPVTTSIDAALALIERKLPGWYWGLGAHSATLLDDADEGGIRIDVSAKTPALALCIALLQALTPQVEGGEDD